MQTTLQRVTLSAGLRLRRLLGSSMMMQIVRLQRLPANGRRIVSQWLTEISCAWVGMNFAIPLSRRAKLSAMRWS